MLPGTATVTAIRLCLLTLTFANAQIDYGLCNCENGGACLTTSGQIFEEDEPLADDFEQCLCAPGWRGYLCQEDQDECRSNPCVHGTCQDSLGKSEYFCNCEPGFTGHNCDRNIDDCASFPCLHGGTCLDGASTFVCMCTAHFTGEHCETQAKVNPIWRDVRGAYVIDAEQHALINPISRSRVGIGTAKPRELLHVRGDAGTDALTVSRFFVSDSQQSQSSLEITERDILSMQTLLKPS